MNGFLETTDQDELEAYKSSYSNYWRITCDECGEDLYVYVEEWPYKNAGLIHHDNDDPDACQFSAYCAHGLGTEKEDSSNNYMTDVGPAQSTTIVSICIVCKCEI